MSTELIQKIDQILEKQRMPERHSFFQIKNFILGKEPTTQGQLWQCIREIQSRKESLETIREDIEMLEDQIQLKDIAITRSTENAFGVEPCENDVKELEIQTRILQREKKKMLSSIKTLRTKVKYIEEELQYFVNAFEHLITKEPLKPLDDIESQEKYWNNKLTEEVNLRILLGRPLDVDLVRTCLSLSDNCDIKKSVIAMIESSQQQVAKERQRRMAEIEGSKRRVRVNKNLEEKHGGSDIIT